MSLTPVPSEGATCPNCSAPLVADQRYCLSCGQPTTPVRLAFLDVLQSERQQSSAGQLPLGATPVAYTPLLEPTGPSGWLRRYSPLLGAASVLLLALIAGLLVGHWVTQNKTPSQQVLKIEGLTAPAAAAVTTTPTTATATPATSTPTSKASKSSASEVKEEAEEAANEAKAEKVQAQKVEKAKTLSESSSSLDKLHKTSGKQHAEEVNSLGAQPIETK